MLFFIVLGFFVDATVKSISKHLEFIPEPFFARLADQLDSKNHINAIKKIEELNANTFPVTFSLINENGQIIYPTDKKLPFDWSTISPPKIVYASVAIGGSGGPPGPPPQRLVRLNGDPPYFLFIDFDSTRMPKHGVGGILLSFGLLIGSVLLGVGIALLLLFRGLNERVKSVDLVISELQRGNLKARFPIRKMDEIGKAMARFNLMADEVEQLVQRLKNVETARMSLLQELAHDLRTPIASLKNLLDTISSKKQSLSETVHEELLTLSQKEVQYFERLVEDLLLLAQAGEPRYRPNQQLVPIVELLDAEIDSVERQYNSDDRKIFVQKNLSDMSIELLGDDHLLMRMFRNTLDNAFTFAKTKVVVSVTMNNENKISFIIEDDGPGLPEETLNNYGTRRITRALSKASNGRVSVGLGSVILKTIANLHRGSVSAYNKRDSLGRVLGASVKIDLPLIK